MNNGHPYIVEGEYVRYTNRYKKSRKRANLTSISIVDIQLPIDDSSDDIDEGIGIWNE